MTTNLPHSNGDVVALNLVNHAIVDEINTPGESLARLFEGMASCARDIGADFHVGDDDWGQMMRRCQDGDPRDIDGTVGRQALAMGDIWAKKWMLCMMAKHIHAELKAQCLNHPGASAIEVVTYSEDGRVDSWSPRKT